MNALHIASLSLVVERIHSRRTVVVVVSQRMGETYSISHLPLGHLCGGGDGCRAIDVVERDRKSEVASNGDQLLRVVWRNVSTVLVVADRALSAPQPLSEVLLGQAEPRTDGENWVHERRVSAALMIMSISGADYLVTAGLILAA